MLGDTVVTKYNSGCLRSILIQSSGIRAGEIPDLYKRCGAAAEKQHAEDLKAAGIGFVPELVIKAQLSPDVEYSGRADFVCHFPAGTVVDETKGHTSKNTRRDVIRKGEYNISYLAQLVSYMVRLRTQRGRLICGYYEETDDDVLVLQEERTFKVEITDAGGIDVDGCPSGFGVDDLLAHQRAAVSVMETQTVAARPDKWNKKYGGPCNLCPFKVTCDAYDVVGGTAEEFLRAAANDVANLVPKPEPKAFKVKKPKPIKAPKTPKPSKKGTKKNGY